MIFVANAIFSQKLPDKHICLLLQKPFRFDKGTNLLLTQLPISSMNRAVIPPDFYIRQLPFFCRQEIKFEKVTRIPFKFRVGTVEDCDRMEGKFKRN